MSMPPPPGQWGPSGPPPPPGPPQQGPPAGYYPPPGPWGGPPQPPPKQNNTIKWLLAGVGVLLIIAITVGVTVLVTRDSSGGDGPTTTPTGEPIASADDDGPIEIITLEPTCQAWMPVSNAMARVQNNGWGDRDPDLSANEWSADLRAQYEAVADSLKEAADQASTLAQETPNRVVRLLYEQFIAYGRAYAERVSSYEPSDNVLARAHVAAAHALTSICNSISSGSAAKWATSVPPIAAPSLPPITVDPNNPSKFMTNRDASCTSFNQRRNAFIADMGPWTEVDSSISAAQWTPAERATAESAIPIMNTYAKDIAALGQSSDNATFQDFASLVDVYVRAYSISLPTYETADENLIVVGTRAANLLAAACDAAEN